MIIETSTNNSQKNPLQKIVTVSFVLLFFTLAPAGFAYGSIVTAARPLQITSLSLHPIHL